MPGRNQRGWRRRTPGRAAPAPPIDAETARLLERIAEIARNVRATWFILLGVLAFAGVTLLGVEDADFFAWGRQTMLPLVGVEIPTRSFFLTTPLLVAALYGYFHFQLRELWRALAPDAIEAEIGERRLADVVHPGLITGWGLRQRHDHRERRSALDRLQGAVVVTLVWGAAPLVLVGLWWRAMPAHEEGLTLANAAALGVVLFVGRGTWVEAKRTLRGRQPGRRLGAVLFTTGVAGWLLVATALGYVSWRRTEGGLDHYADWAAERWNATVGEDALAYDEDEAAWRSAAHPRVAAWINAARGIEARFVDADMRWYAPSRLDALAPVDLEGVSLVPRPADWRSHEVAHDAFRDAWCDRKDQGPTTCADFIAEHEDDFEAAWDADRAATLDKLPRLLRPGADLRAARLQGVFAPRIDLTNARLAGADLEGARLEGADLSEARLEDANLRGARLEGALLWEARLGGAELFEARLEGADLRAAWLEDASLRGARLEDANLRGARLEGALLWAARLDRADLFEARLEGAVLVRAQLEDANLYSARLEGADLREAQLEGADLGGARLEDALLWEARLGGADLLEARLETGLEGAILEEAGLEGAILSAADLTGTTLNQEQIAGAIGDATTVLPRDAETGAQLYVRSCWNEPPPTLDQTLATWQETWRWLLRDDWLCNGRPREKVGRPAPEPEEAPENGSAAASAPSP